MIPEIMLKNRRATDLCKESHLPLRSVARRARSVSPAVRFQNSLAVAMQNTVMTSSPPAMRSPLVIFARNWVCVA